MDQALLSVIAVHEQTFSAIVSKLRLTVSPQAYDAALLALTQLARTLLYTTDELLPQPDARMTAIVSSLKLVPKPHAAKAPRKQRKLC